MLAATCIFHHRAALLVKLHLAGLRQPPGKRYSAGQTCLSCDRSKQELDVLATVNTKLTAESAHSKADLHDINEYLCNQLKATALTNATLSSRIDDLEHRLLETSRAHAVSMTSCNCQQEIRIATLAAA